MSDTNGQSILLVEDDDVLRSVIRINLVKRGRFVREAATLVDAKLAIADGRPDLLILDLNLPDGSGQELLQNLRGRGVAIPTIVISAGSITTMRLVDTGPVWFLPKPFRIDALLDVIQLVERRVGVGNAPHPNPLPRGEGIGIPDAFVTGQGFWPSNPLAPAEDGGPPRSSLELPAWTRELRTACITLGRAPVRSIRSMTLGLRVSTASGEPSPVDLAARLAAEYGLSCQSELRPGILRVQLRRDDGFPIVSPHDGDEREATAKLPLAKLTLTNSREDSPTR